MTNDAPTPDDELAAHTIKRARAASARAQAQRDAVHADTERERKEARAAKNAPNIAYAIAGRMRGREERAAALLRERGWAVLSPHQPRTDEERATYQNDMQLARTILGQ